MKQSQTAAYNKRRSPPQKLSFEINGDLLRKGFYFCRACQRITQPKMSTKPKGFAVCIHCDSRNIIWKKPIYQS